MNSNNSTTGNGYEHKNYSTAPAKKTTTSYVLLNPQDLYRRTK